MLPRKIVTFGDRFYEIKGENWFACYLRDISTGVVMEVDKGRVVEENGMLILKEVE